MEDIDIKGGNNVFFEEGSEELAFGRGFNPLDLKKETKVAILGSGINRDMFLDEDPIGKDININGLSFKIIEVLKSGSEFDFSSNNDSIFIPYTTAMTTLSTRDITEADVYMSDSSKSEQIIEDIKLVLNISFNYKENAYFIFNFEDIIDAIGDIKGLMTILLAGSRLYSL